MTMGDMADYDLYENINNCGSVERTIYKCGYCGERFYKKEDCQTHVNNCEQGVKRVWGRL